ALRDSRLARKKLTGHATPVAQAAHSQPQGGEKLSIFCRDFVCGFRAHLCVAFRVVRHFLRSLMVTCSMRLQYITQAKTMSSIILHWHARRIKHIIVLRCERLTLRFVCGIAFVNDVQYRLTTI